MAAGMAAGALQTAIKYYNERVQFKKKIQAKLDRCVAVVQQSILLCMQMSRLYDKNPSKFTIGRATLAKDGCTRNAREVSQLTREAMAENRILVENQMLKLLVDIDEVHIFDRCKERSKAKPPSLGVIHLDYYYPPVPGDMDSTDSFAYPVYYRVVPGLTFEMCQTGRLSPQVAASFAEAVRWLDQEKNVSAISGDCGFMIWFQELARNIANKPVSMSPLS